MPALKLTIYSNDFKGCLAMIIGCLCCLNALAQKEPFTSRIYFPGLIGINIPAGNSGRLPVKNGFTLNTAIEYRPLYANAIFFRFNYDALSNNYQDNNALFPTNVVQGKVHTNFFNLGAGYRFKRKKIGLYALLQPGVSIKSFDRVTNRPGGYALTQVTNKRFNLKFTTGVEYYIALHFALIAEPCYYAVSSKKSHSSSVAGFSIGFTTTLF